MRSCSGVTAPGRNNRGLSPTSETTVDSTPTEQSLPITTASIFPSRSFITWRAVVGLGLPEVFADGAASGKPLKEIMSQMVLSLGNLTATVSSPADTLSATLSARGNTIVKGPGQNAFAQA